VIEANYTELQQCLLNLCLNAVQAMPEGGTLRLSADSSEEQGVESVRMRIADTGIGMDAQTVAKLFTPFFSTKEDGTGLGLMSCKRIVESYGGRIEVKSEAGAGTVFALSMPVAHQVDEHPDAAEGHGQRILVIDGDATRLTLVANALGSQGYDPQAAHDGVMALHLLDAEMPEVLIVDGEIMQASAISLLPVLREKGYAGPVIALEDATKPIGEQEVPQGMSLQVLSKPLEMRKVFHAVERALQRPGS
jgi:CheY-like chemotaxis protein/anti-sigma regulatory factor (Ser/Thr protein kinase)